ncbi:zinc finger and BTB domain-containing protein 41-like isoform X7 [Ostrinia nubilalis]|uniref:zinc finger and BTB domain-containing protein 41-like isoform X7 n=1 Tax=Ostrinia nubilalis TaxID=29057 RepID=UPI0030826097
MEFDEIVVKESPGLCRCCLSEGCYKDLGTEYTWMNENEVYADMLLECFDISISQHNEGPNGPSRLICEVCITRLRDACNFKKQVLDSEKKFVDMIGRGDFRPKVMIYQSQMKAEASEETPTEDTEVEYLDEMDFGDADDEPLKNEASGSDIAVEALPLPKRGRPPKARKAVKGEKKKTKAEDRPKASKTIVKETGFRLSLPSLDGERTAQWALRNLVAVIVQHSTIMPFRWSSNKFMCFYCCCPFHEVTKLKSHTLIEHENAKLQTILMLAKTSSRLKLDVSEISCRKCPKSLRNLDEFLDHAASAHDLEFNRESSKTFLCFKLSDEGMSCLDCDERFQFFGTLLTHTHKYHNKCNSFLCEICGQGFVSQAHVAHHLKKCHSEGECVKCQKKFRTQYALTLHNEKEHRTWKCPKCTEVLGSRYLRKRHMALAHDVGNNIFKCDECEKIFVLRHKLIEHKARIHLKEKKMECPICGFKVFNKELLKRHMVRHDDTRPFECDICKKTFQRKKTLDFHRRIHTNDKRYVCKDCGKSFVQVASLKLHIKVHHTSNESSSWN